MARRHLMLAAMVVTAIAGTVTTFAQRPGGLPRRESSTQSYSGNVRYDGRFTFVRMSYAYGGRQNQPWSHDYPGGEYHFLKILTSVSNVSAHLDESSIMSFSDPELFKFPVAYLVEPGYWHMSENDVTSLRAYLLKGGFLIVDDFPYSTQGRFDTWANFDLEMTRVFPEGRWIRLDSKSQIFHSFFEIDDITNIPTAYSLGKGPEFWALFEDNDPSKRMYAIANYQNDLSEFWEFSETGRFLIQDSNEAYKFGVNEFIYGLTH